MLGETRHLGWQVFERAFLLEKFQRRQCRGAAKRIAAVGVAMEERPRIFVAAEKRGQADDVEQQRLEHRMESRYAADADAAERVAMIRVGEGQVLGSSWLGTIALPPELKRHLQRHFDRRSAVVREEDVIQTGRRNI